MSSDGYFDDELDSAVLQQFDIIDAQYRNGTLNTVAATKPKPPPPPPQPTIKPAQKPRPVIVLDDSDEFGEFDDIVIDEAALRAIDQACADAMAKSTQKTTAPIAGPSHRRPISRTSSKATVQTTLDGRVLTQSSPPKRAGAPNGSRSPLQRRTSSAGNNVFRGKSKKTKQWDHTAFAKTGWKQPKGAKGKEKAFGSFEDEEVYEDEDIEFEQFPAPFMPIGPPVPMKLQIDRLAARRWIYPLNQPKRDYQYNIVRKCLYENTLVALPTGLGKTFIAGVVMLNFYTWFPEGKVVFVAPTKPLVAQQIDACHKTCGIPGSHAAELTGQNSRQVRARAWEEKRVFYMTPQTLMNDLRTDNCDPSDIVLLVIDEAHKGSGDYAYAQVIRYLMAKNPHFRVLALTATPGSKPETVQTIVDALHISHIEIRDERSLDLKQYMHKKHTVQHVLPMSEEILRVRDLLAKVMDPMIKKLAGAGILHANPSPVMIHPFVCLQAMKGLHGRGGGAPWAFPMLQKLNSLARAMGYLYECSISQCYTCINEIMTAPPKGKQKENPNKSDPNMQAILQELEAQRGADGGFPIHPKFEKLKTLLIEHFAQKQFDKEDADANGRGADVSGDSRVMLFSTYRQCVDEIVQFLNKDRPMIRAIPFIGQSTDKSGKKGYGQKEQLEVIKKFKAGEYNVLVSTSIGEEGLDIGEIDMIICYEAQKSSVRMLQRIGRTGRKRDGHVHVMMSEVREERNWDRANENYEDVQRFIIRAEDLELYGDVGRLVPPEFNPEPIEQEMPIEEYVRDDGPPKRVPKSPKSKTGKGKTREKDPTRNIPRGAMSGFVSASKLVEKGRLSPLRELDSDALNSDSDDQEIMAGIHGPRRTKSMPSKSGTSKKKSLRRTVTTAAGTSKKTKGTRKKKQELEVEREKSLDPADIRLEDDSDDEAIERGLSAKARPSKRASESRAPPKASSSRLHTDLPPSSPEIPLADDIIDLTASDPPVLEPSPLPRSSPSSPPASPGQRSDTLVNKQPSRSRSTSSLTWLDQPSPTSSRVRPLEKATEPEDAADIAWLLDDDESDVPAVGSSPPRGYDDTPFFGRDQSEESAIVPDAEIEMILDDYDIEVLEPPPYLPSTPIAHRDEPRLSPPSRQRADMPPPPVPARFAMPSPSSDSEFGPPPSTFAVRGPGMGKGKGKKRARVAVDSSPVTASPSSGPPRRLQRGRPSSLPEQAASPVPDDLDEGASRPNKRRRRRFQDIVDAQRHNPFMDVEANHSGNESSDGGMERDGEFGSEGDMQFVEELPATQASPSYDQSAVYRRSLMTQAGPSAVMPAFSRRPVRRGAGYVYATPSRTRRPVQLSSSPEQQHDDDDDYYQIGSFIVDDEEDVSYATDGFMPSDP